MAGAQGGAQDDIDAIQAGSGLEKPIDKIDDENTAWPSVNLKHCGNAGTGDGQRDDFASF